MQIDTRIEANWKTMINIQDRSSDKPCDSVEVTKLMNFAQFKKQRSTKASHLHHLIV